MRQIRSYRQVANPAAEDIIAQVTAQADRLQARLLRIRRVVVVGSGKGGVGKSALTANLAAALGHRNRVGALDADLNGPSLGRMLGASGQQLRITEDGVTPAPGIAGTRVVSTDLLLPSETPLRWKHPAGPDGESAPAFLIQSLYEGTVLRELLADSDWGDLDFLLIDAPPGTDKLERLLQLLPDPPITILVTTPSQIARNVVARSATLLKHRRGTTGLVVNMASQVCIHCGKDQPLFGRLTAAEIARESGLETWASIPFDPKLAATTDAGAPIVQTEPAAPSARAILELAHRLEAIA